jgi:hypothetical protein
MSSSRDIEQTKFQLVRLFRHLFNSSTAVVDIVNIKEQRKLTPSNSNNPMVLLLGKLMPSVDYFWKLIVPVSAIIEKGVKYNLAHVVAALLRQSNSILIWVSKTQTY